MRLSIIFWLLVLSLSVSAIGGMSRPTGLGQEQGYDQPTLTCPSCYNRISPRSGSEDKSSVSFKASMFSRGSSIVPSKYYGVTYAPNLYLGLDRYYRHRGRFSPYAARSRLGAEKGLSIVHQVSDHYEPAQRVVSSYRLMDGKLVKVE